MSQMPEGYENDYMVFSCCDTIGDYNKIKDVPIETIFKFNAFRKFDNYVRQETDKAIRKRNGGT